jgi:hypothetical protein
MLGRKYELILGRPVTFNQGVFQAETSSVFNENFSLEDQILNTQGQSIVISEHQMEFKISRNANGDLGSATISVYNPSPSTVDYLRANAKQNISVVFRCGYEDNYATAFIGTLTKSMHISEGVDQQVRLIVTDGEVSTKEAYTSRTYKKGTPVSTVLDGLLSDMKMPTGVIQIPEGYDTPIKKNIIIAGKTSEQLKKLADDLTANFFISNGVLDFLPKFESSTNVETIYRLNNNTGMIGSPVPLDTGADVKEASSKNIYQLTVKSLLLPFVKIGDLIALESAYNISDDGNYHSGVFKIIAIQHSGSYEGEDWTTTLDIESTTGYRVVS